MLDIIERLHHVQGTLTDPQYPYWFMQITACICGHIYANALAQEAPREVAPTDLDHEVHAVEMAEIEGHPVAMDTIREILAALARGSKDARTVNFLKEGGIASSEAWTLSSLTANRAKWRDDTMREAAIGILGEAIDIIEREQAEAMLKVARMSRPQVKSTPKLRPLQVSAHPR